MKEEIEKAEKRYKLFVILAIVAILVCFYFLFFNHGKQCLDEIAEEYCITQNLSYSSTIILPLGFFCHNVDDKRDVEEFRFLGEDLKVCRRIG